MSSRIIGIGGGVGPMAGVKLHEKIVALTPATSDKEHLDVFHFSCSSDIADRTRYSLTGEGENPAMGMFRKVKAIHQAAAVYQKEVVLGIPCNSFHVPVIFTVFRELVHQHYPTTRLIHMLEETAQYLNAHLPKLQKVGLLSTTGTRQSKVYQHTLAISLSAKTELIEVPEQLQAQVHESIYHPEWGIKAHSGSTPKARANFLHFANVLIEAGAEAIILGCTEIPLVLSEPELQGTPLVDPVHILAKALIAEAPA
ncbi:MAG: amino acid racemase [Bacteroidota bacterium]